MVASMRLLLVAVGISSAAAARSLLRPNVDNGQSEKTTVLDGTAAPRRVRIQFIRHAFSCANMVQQFAASGTLTRWGGSLGKAFLRDPMLSECGAVRSKSAGEMLHRSTAEAPDFVLSSSMLRAMETAAYMFPGSTITPVPYISENRHTDLEKDNLPLDVRSQLDQLDKAIASNRTDAGPLLLLRDNLDLKWMEDSKFGAEGSDSPRMSSSWEKFEDFMANVFLPHVDARKYPQPELLTIAIVSHSNFLKGIPDVKKHCSGFYSDKPANNQVLELLFDYSAKMIVTPRRGSTPIFEMVVDPFDSNSDGIWAAMQNSMGDKGNRDIVFGELALGEDGIKTKIRRKLDAVGEQDCINHINVAPPLSHLCQRDIGSVCIDELAKAFPKQNTRPKLETRDRALLMAKADLHVVIGKMDKTNKQDKYLKEQEELQNKVGELERLQCCAE